ncbi:unnamed protein product [Tilletia caries]|nr:unnamed protein product [Tilletia caries]
MPSRKSLGKVSYPSKSQAPAGASAADSKKKAPQLLHQDSLRADIEAARESMGSPESAKPSMASLTATTAKSGDNGGQEEEEEDGGLDLADELLAALDARRDADDGVKTAGAQSESGVRSMFNGGMKKKSKAQVKKEKREAEEEAMRVQAREELKANGGQPDLAAAERRGIGELCEVYNAEMYEINPDGHCLYAAVADQLGVRKSQPTDYKSTRHAAAEYMRAHPDDFLPFIADGDVVASPAHTSIALRSAHFEEYCSAIENTGVWGGQPEILALSHAYEVPIHVAQVGMPVLKIGEDNYGSTNRVPLVISYHRHMYGLGEHYNSLRPR